MLPSVRQFRGWVYPTKFGFFTGLIGLLGFVMSILFWLFPDSGKQLIQYFPKDKDISVIVPGNDIFERQINLAKIDGITSSIPSAEFAAAIPFVRPVIIHGYDHRNSLINIVSLSNASILASENQDIVFAPGRCRFIGYVEEIVGQISKGHAAITVMSCVMDNGDSYEYGKFDGPEIGFLTQIDQPTNKEITLIKDDKIRTIPLNGKYLVRFFKPLRDIKFQGKANTHW